MDESSSYETLDHPDLTLRGLATYLSPFYPFLSQEEVLAAIGWPTTFGDQASEGQMSSEATNGVGDGVEDVFDAGGFKEGTDVGTTTATVVVNDEAGAKEESAPWEQEITIEDTTKRMPQESIIEEEFTIFEWLYLFFLSLILSSLSDML